jgi:N-acetylornithine carbamoyltransferase
MPTQSFLELSDVPEPMFQRLLERSLWHRHNRTYLQTARDRTLGMLFFNPSLRTRTSMELAAQQLGALSTTIIPGQGTWGFAWEEGVPMLGEASEHIKEAVGVLSRYVDAIGVRAFATRVDYEADRSDRALKTIAQFSRVPVINLESAFYHPCQGLADASVMMDHFKGDVSRKKFVLAWCYHPRPLPMAVPHSALLTAARLGMDVTVAAPAGFALDEQVMARAAGMASQHGGSLSETTDMDEAMEGAHVVYAKAWAGRAAYTNADEEAALRHSHEAWRVTENRMRRTDRGVFMHCLPVRRNVVVDDAVLDGNQALHLDQAAYRLHAAKATLEYVWDVLPTST